MIILIAEAKTMKREQEKISLTDLESNIPLGEKQASEIMTRINKMSVSEITSLVKISTDMGRGLKEMAYEFPNKSLGYPAIEAFTGVVFKCLDFSTLPTEGKRWTDKHVRIISSLYGWLRPSDIIKPYRLEYTTPLSPDHQTLSVFWRAEVTEELIKNLKASGENEILDLLPADAAKAVDWKEVNKYAKVWKVDFKELNGESVRSPHAGKLKALRGGLLRSIILQRLNSAKATASIVTDFLYPIEDYGQTGKIGFYV